MKMLLLEFALISCSGCVSATGRVETNAAFALPSGVEVRIVEAPFLETQFRLDGCNEVGAACRINGHIPYGVESDIPKTYIKSISVTFQKKTHSLDASDMYDAWGSRHLQHKGSVRYFGGECFDENNCQFRGLFSDAAGSFVAEWRIVNGYSYRTVLTTSDDVMDLFMKHIDPPTFD